MRRAFIWSLRLAAILAVITSIALLFYVFSAPSIAEHKIRTALREMGLGETSVQVRSIGTNHLQITNLVLGEEAGLRVGAIGVDYDTTLTGNVTVKTIEVIGATLDLRSEAGKLDIGPLADIKSSDAQSRLASDGLPFDRIIVRNSSIILQWQGRRFSLPMEATITHKQQGECEVDATVWLLSTGVPFKGVIDFSAPDATIGGAVADDTAAQGVSFRLSTPVGEQALVLAGMVGSEAVGTHITATIEHKGEASELQRIAVATFSRSSATGATLSIETSASPQPLRLFLAGYEMDATAFSLRAKAAIDLDSMQLDGGLELEASDLRIATADQVFHWVSPEFAGDFEGQFEDEDFVVKALKSTHLKHQAMTVTNRGADVPTMKAGPMRIDCTQAELRWPRTSDPARRPELRLALDVRSALVEAGDHHVALSRFAPSVVARLNVDGDLALRGSLNITDVSYRNAPATIEMLGLSASVPFAFNDDSSLDEGTLAIKSIRYGEDMLPAVTGTMHVVNGRLITDATWPVQEKFPLKLATDVDFSQGLSPEAMAGTVSARWKDVVIDDEEAVARLIKAAKLFRITGRFDMDARFTLGGGRLTPHIVLVASDANFAAAELDLNLRGIDTTIIINSLDPLATMPNQRLSIAGGNIGELRFTDVIANFRLDAIDAMVLELAAWRVGGRGRFWVHAAHFNPLDAVLETQVFIEDMSVSEWLQIVQDNKITGEGFLYGRIPIRIDRSRDPVLTFGEGFLYAKPGKGWVKLAERAEDRRQTYETIEQAIADLAKEAKRRFLEAVNDYEFDTLQFDFIRKNSTILCRVTTTGRGRIGNKQEIGGLVVNIDNFGALLSERILRTTGSLGALDDELERLFE